ncbi:MAG: hypothetical protein J2P37_12765 [Ktedonobacteraceae bacterium]|nr:hypothetical protein [Ktedonobacteraceae bacterium]
MQSKDLHQIKAAIRDQAFLGNARVFCIMGPVVAARRRKGQLLAMIRGWGRWYPVESVRIEYAGRQLLLQTTPALARSGLAQKNASSK